MKKIKKLLFVFVALFAFSTASYALETSIGTQTGLGVGLWNNNGGQYVIDNPNLIEFNVMVEFMPYFALETGIDINNFTLDSGKNAFGVTTPKVSIFTATVPIMFRGQYENETGVVYASAGIKLGFAGGYVATTTMGIFGYPITNYLRDDGFTMDVAFALGYEWRVGDANYLGLRANYDLNVIKQHKDFSYDNTRLAFTYRYAFGSKWKNK